VEQAHRALLEQRAAVQLTKEVPYETACELFAELTGLPLSAHTAHEVTQAVAEGLTVLDVAPSREEILAQMTALAAHSGAGHRWRQCPHASGDGARSTARAQAGAGQAGPVDRGAAGLNRPTRASAMSASNGQGRGGTVTNANQMLALRCAKYNGTFDRVFARYRPRIQDQSG